MRVPRSLGTCATVALVLGLFAATPALRAGASPPPPLWVSATTPVGADTSCLSPGFTTISAALIAAASGQTINVCHDQYVEQLAITRPVTLKAIGQVTLFGPVTPSDTLTSCDADGPGNQAVIDICMSGRAVIDGFRVIGQWPADVCNDNLYGVTVLGGGFLNMSQSKVEHIGGDPLTDGCQGGVGIQVGEATSATTADPGHATLTGDEVDGYAKNGITIDGTGSSATLTGATVTGAGETPAIAQNGIQVSDGARATIKQSVVSANECDDIAGGCDGGAFPPSTEATGILLFDAGKTTVEDSTLSANDTGLYNQEDVAWAYYTPPSPFHAIVETFTGMTLDNRYSGAIIDAGVTAINGSRIAGGGVGIDVIQYYGQAIGATLTANHDTITGARNAAVAIETNTTSGLPDSVSITNSSMDLSNGDGIDNLEGLSSDVPIVHAVDDWWGSASGPSFWGFGSGAAVDPNVDYFPWALTSAINTFKTCKSGTNVSTTGNEVVLCAAGTGNDTLTNAGSGTVLLIGNNGTDHLNASATGNTYIIPGTGSNVINEATVGNGHLQTRGNFAFDTFVNPSPFFFEDDS